MADDKGDQLYTLACLVNVYLKNAAGDLLHFIFRDRYVVKVLWEGRFAFSSNSVCMAKKPDTIIINHQLEFSRTKVKYLDHEKRAYKHEIWSYRISEKASYNRLYWRVQRD